MENRQESSVVNRRLNFERACASCELTRRAFEEYASHFDLKNERVQLKLTHMYKVADLSRLISNNIGCSESVAALAYAVGLFHDIGRFEQLRDYDTFSDAASVDHAELSVQVMEQSNMLPWISSEDRISLLAAVQNHNKLAIDPSIANARTLMMCRIIRDADKIDIFRVFNESSIESITGCHQSDIENSSVSAAVIAHIEVSESVPVSDRATALDKLVSTLGFLYDINYPISMELILEQGHYRHLLTKFNYEDAQTASTVCRLLTIAENYARNFASKDKE